MQFGLGASDHCIRLVEILFLAQTVRPIGA